MALSKFWKAAAPPVLVIAALSIDFHANYARRKAYKAFVKSSSIRAATHQAVEELAEIQGEILDIVDKNPSLPIIKDMVNILWAHHWKAAHGHGNCDFAAADDNDGNDDGGFVF